MPLSESVDGKEQDQSLLGRRGKVGVVRAAGILDAHQDTVAPGTTLAKVVGLEIVRFLGPAILVEVVMNGVNDVERVDAGGINVVSTSRRQRGVVGIVEDA